MFLSPGREPIGEGQMLAIKKGKMHCSFKSTNCSTLNWTLFPVKVVRGIQEDLFSFRAELSKGGVLFNDGRKNSVLDHGNGQNIVFDRHCKT